MVFIGGVGNTVISLQTTQRVLSASDSMGVVAPPRNNSNADSKLTEGPLQGLEPSLFSSFSVSKVEAVLGVAH